MGSFNWRTTCYFLPSSWIFDMAGCSFDALMGLPLTCSNTGVWPTMGGIVTGLMLLENWLAPEYETTLFPNVTTGLPDDWARGLLLDTSKTGFPLGMMGTGRTDWAFGDWNCTFGEGNLSKLTTWLMKCFGPLSTEVECVGGGRGTLLTKFGLINGMLLLLFLLPTENAT